MIFRPNDHYLLNTANPDGPLFSHTLTEAFKAYAGQKKSKSRPRGLNHLSRPPDLLNPRNRRTKEKEKHLVATSPSK
jgi:hypothetical protein